MISPARRVMIYPSDRTTCEILIVGAARETLEISIVLRKTIETWRGFEWTSIVALDDGCRAPTMLGVAARVGEHARFSDPVAEALLAIRECRDLKAIRWSGGNAGSDSALGMIGTW